MAAIPTLRGSKFMGSLFRGMGRPNNPGTAAWVVSRAGNGTHSLWTNAETKGIKVESNLIRKVAGFAALGQLGILLAFGQAATEPKPLLAEDVFKNIQVLKGIP